MNHIPKIEWSPVSVTANSDGSPILTNIANTSEVVVGRVVRSPLITGSRKVVSKTINSVTLDGTTLGEPARTNFLLRNQDLNDAAWIKTRSNVSQNATIAPDGTLTADKLIEDTTAANSHFTLQSVTATVAQIWSLSFFAKAAERSFLTVSITNGGAQLNNVLATFNLITGATTSLQNNGGGSGATTSFIAYPNGWFKFTISGQADISGTIVQTIFRLNNGSTTSYTGDGVSGLFIWGTQLEIGSSSTSYIPSVQAFTSRASTATFVNSLGLLSTAANNVARLGYNPADLSVSPSLLLEAAATNLLLRSQEFDNASWTPSAVTVTADAAIAPDGTTTADKLIVNLANTTTGAAAVQAVSKPASVQTYTYSIFAKESEFDVLQILVRDTATGVNNAFVRYSLVNGSRTLAPTINGTFTNAYSQIQAYPNGWFRVSLTFTTSTEVSIRPQVYALDSVSGVGDGVSGIFIWGAQLELGSGPTSYIPTTSLAVTRAADVSSSVAGVRAISSSSFNFFDSFQFKYPSTTSARPELETKSRISTSISGIRQVSIDHILKKVDLTFEFLDDSEVDTLENNFFLPWASRGNPFNYFPSYDEDSFEEYELASLDFSPERTHGRSGDEFAHKLKMKLRRIAL